MELKLKKPIKHGEELIEVIELREPTAKDIKKFSLPINSVLKTSTQRLSLSTW